MYCSACGTQLAPGLSFCNRCGMSLKERAGSKAGPIAAFLTAITIIGVGGLGIMLGGTLALTTEAHLKEELVGFFMLFTFLIVAITEVLLVRQLSRFTAATGQAKAIEAPQQLSMPGELHASQTPRTLVEARPSVTENTTRTLQYSPNEPSR
jgi:predicted nucleic acid-binding Zn ribbon protein